MRLLPFISLPISLALSILLHHFHNRYYLPRNNSADTGPVLAFPGASRPLAFDIRPLSFADPPRTSVDGLRMLIGSPFLRSYNEPDLMSQAIGWNCLGQAANPTRNPFLPPNDCPDGLRGELRFPSCWGAFSFHLWTC